MKTISKTLTLGTRFSHLYRPLVRNLFLIILGTAVLAGGTLIYFDERLVDSLSGRLIEKSTQTTNEKLRRLFDAADNGLRVALRQVEALEITDPEGRAQLFGALTPFLSSFDFLDSINLADAAGNEYVLIKQAGEVLVRHVDTAQPGVAHWQRHVDGAIAEEWTRQSNNSPLERPWYQGAMQRDPGGDFWTPPYRFLTTKEPGLSVSSRWTRPQGGGDYVMAFNIALTDISHYTTQLRPSEHGMTVIFGREDKTIGLPPDDRFADDSALLSAVLSPVTELGIPAINAALAAWEDQQRAPGIFRYRTADQAPWWAGLAVIELDQEHQIWSATLIPEQDFLGSLS
ncbi:MAG: hypothetical protein RLZ44_1127, partial [Pseudomonadota bacterium]